MPNSIYQYVIERSKDNDSFRQSVVEQYRKNARFSRKHFQALLWPLFLLTKAKDKKRFFFFTAKYHEIILKLPREDVCVIGGPKQLLFAIKNKVSLISNMNFWEGLSKCMQTYELSAEFLTKASLFEKELNKVILPNSVFIVDNDSMPMQRFLIDIMRKNGAKICLIQDGLFQHKTAPHIIHGWYSDRVLCYDKYQQSIIANKLPENIRIDVIGFYKEIPFYTISKNPRRVCFLGQPWCKYGEDFGVKYVSLVERINKTLSGYNVTYKPHPWENDTTYIDKIGKQFKGSMGDAFKNFDIFISLTSTALLEATMAGKIAIQVIDEKFECDDLSNYKYAYSLNSDDVYLENFEKLISQGPILKFAPDTNAISRYVDYFQLEKYI